MGLVATMTALVLGLLVASTKAAYDTERNEITTMAARIDYVDALLSRFGPEGEDARAHLRSATATAIQRLWQTEAPPGTPADPSAAWAAGLAESIEALTPQNDLQKLAKTQAISEMIELGRLRYLLFAQSESSISTPMLSIVIVWLAITFLSIGLFAPSNFTVNATLALAAMSVSAAIYLIMELDRPFGGMIRISSSAMRAALEHIGH